VSAARSYADNDPRGWCGDPKRGAAMGRAMIHDAPRAEPLKLRLCHVPLNSGGYDRLGTYFGLGAPLYWYASDDGRVDAMLRASDGRGGARAKIREFYPNARFFR